MAEYILLMHDDATDDDKGAVPRQAEAGQIL